jgi:hypothetical protein
MFVPPPTTSECLLETSSPKEGGVPFERTIIDVTGTPHRRINGGTFVGYSERAAIRRERCGMMHESGNSGAKIDGR